MTAVQPDSISDNPALKRRDWLTIGLLSSAHACSHFYQLIIPTLYLSLAHEYGYDFVKLGMLVSVFFVVSSLGQASSGFIVDRIGAPPVLRFGLICFVLSGVLIGMSGGYAALMLAAVIGGIGNSVFHPADYAIINHRIRPERLGHAYSIHGLTGNLGWALTPVFMLALIHAFDWRVAVFCAVALIAFVLVLTWLGRSLLESDEAEPAASPRAGAADEPDLSGESIRTTLAILLVQPALWGAFLFFAFTSMALSAVQNYTIPMLGDVYGLDKVLAGTALSSYMVASAVGMIIGGFLVSANPKTERTVAVSLVLAGGLLLVLALGAVAPFFAIGLVALAGFCSGVSTPSRDMLIRRATPKGATGTVYGLVYSGMDIGASLAPVGFGLLLDAGYRQAPWVGAAAGFVIAAFLALWVAKSVGAPQAGGAKARQVAKA